MPRPHISIILALMLSCGQAAVAQSTAPPQPDADQSVNVPVTALKFYTSPEGLSLADARGDPRHGPHSNYIRIPAATGSPLHIHTSSYYGVVIAGVVSNERSGDPDRPLMAGSYWYQKGKEPHITKCISQVECLIFVTSQGAFDFIPVAAPGAAARPGH